MLLASDKFLAVAARLLESYAITLVPRSKAPWKFVGLLISGLFAQIKILFENAN